MIRRVPWIAFVLGCAVQLAAPRALAVDATGEEDALNALLDQRAPLAMSANGRWRFHVDARQILHRVDTRSNYTQSVLLPVPAISLATDAGGERLVFSSASSCIGLVDFNAKSPPVVAWLPSSSRVLPGQATPRPVRGKPDEHECGHGASSALALSANGRLLATASQVYDIDRRRVVAQLPHATASSGGSAVTRLAFTDADTRILMVASTLGEGWESIGIPSKLQLGVWDLLSHRMIRLETAAANQIAALLAHMGDYLPRSASWYWIDTSGKRSLSRTGVRDTRVQLVRTQLHACHARTESLMNLDPFGWQNLLIDPLGRWIALVRKRDAGKRGSYSPNGGDEEVLVREIKGGRKIAKFFAPNGIRGLMASADGSSIHGLSANVSVDADGLRNNYGGDPIRFDLPRARLDALPSAQATRIAECALEDETPVARSIKRTVRILEPLWSISLPEAPTIFREPRGVVWLDSGTTIAMLDPLTGSAGKPIATPRRENVISLAAPLTGGFISHEGDTLSWRAFDGGSPRRVIARRPGWRVDQVNLHGRGVVVFWAALESTRVPILKDGSRRDVQVITYDSTHLKAVAHRTMQSDALGIVGDKTDAQYGMAHFAPCTDSAGPIVSAFDWRVSHLNSLRMLSCGATAAKSKTIFWSHTDVAARPESIHADWYANNVQALAHDGAIAVARDGKLLRIFDIDSRTEIAQVSLEGKVEPFRAIAMEQAGLVVLQHARDDGSSHAAAYSFRRFSRLK